jgi:uracil-DNA glycosylase family 4
VNRLDVRELVLICTKCELHRLSRAPVPFSGPTPSYLAIVGEAPGKVEDRRGEPFVGPAGELLRDCLTAVGIKPETVFMCNSCSCWPNRPDRTPRSNEVNACSTNLAAQLELADPVWVCLLGGIALSTLRPDLKISRTRGHVLVPEGRRRYFVAFHPSYALRNAKGEVALRADLQALATMLVSEDWLPLADDSCVVCGTDPETLAEHDLHLRFDDMGASYCSACWHASPDGKVQAKATKARDRTQVRTGRLFTN